MRDGAVVALEVEGGRNGRISYSGNSGEVRIYRNASTKTYEAVLTGVEHVISDRVLSKTLVPSRDKWGTSQWGTSPIPNLPTKEDWKEGREAIGRLLEEEAKKEEAKEEGDGELPDPTTLLEQEF